MYSRAFGALLLAFVVTLVLASSMPSVMAYSGIATYEDFYPDLMEWKWNSQHCTIMDSQFDMNYRQRYQWTEFCGDLGPYSQNAGCHLCLQVTNPASSDGVSVTVRIIDICDESNDDGPVLYMDRDAFEQIDSEGNTDGQVMVNYQMVNCRDEG